MALNWSRQRARDQMRSARSSEIETARLLSGTDTFEPEPSKAELRAETEALIAAYRGPVQRLPTFRDVRCPCGHQGRVKVAPGRAMPRLRCSRCGSRIR